MSLPNKVVALHNSFIPKFLATVKKAVEGDGDGAKEIIGDNDEN